MIKSGTPEGFMKLSKNNSSISWTFSLNIPAGYSSYIGTVYQRATMDSFSSNTQRTYGNYSTSSSATTEEGNFRLEVNDQIVDKSQYMNMTYEELTAGGDNSSFLGENYSPIGLCPIGQVMLYNGANVMRYTRLGSYNLTISNFVFVVSLSVHSHAATSEWYHDDNYHWHGCSAPGCPVDGGAKLDMALHSWGERYEEVASTCQTVGSYKQQCTVCGYVRTVEVPTTAHNYGDWVVVKEATCSEDGLKQRVCLICGLEENQTIKAQSSLVESTEGSKKD